jgi:hypothetical protein
MNKNAVIVLSVIEHKKPIKLVCQEFEVSRSWVYELLRRHRILGPAAFEKSSITTSVPTKPSRAKPLRLNTSQDQKLSRAMTQSSAHLGPEQTELIKRERSHCAGPGGCITLGLEDGTPDAKSYCLSTPEK